MSLAPGDRLGAYEILAAIGAGGMGEIYRARDTRLGREVAIKAIAAGYSSDPDRLQRFEQEARAAATLNHPNILAVYDIGTHDGAPFIVSELLEGETLRERMNAGPLFGTVSRKARPIVSSRRGTSRLRWGPCPSASQRHPLERRREFRNALPWLFSRPHYSVRFCL